MSKIAYLQHDGACIGYRDDGEGRPLVLVHGTGGNGEVNFSGLMPYLSNRRVIRPDYAGSGLTDDPVETLTLDRLAGQVLAAVDHAGVETFDLLGFSLGAAVAVRLASRQPKRVERLSLIGGFVSGADPRSQLQFRHWADLAGRDPASLARLMLLTGFSHAFLAGINDMEAVVSEMVASSNWVGITRQAELNLQVDVSSDLADIRAHTLVLSNQQDQMVDPKASFALADGIRRTTLDWIDGPHLALMETPKPVAGLLKRFFHD